MPWIPPARSWLRGGRDQAIADATDGQEVARAVRVDLELLAQAPHGDPDVGRFRLVGDRPAAVQEGFRGDGLTEVGSQGEQQP